MAGNLRISVQYNFYINYTWAAKAAASFPATDILSAASLFFKRLVSSASTYSIAFTSQNRTH